MDIHLGQNLEMRNVAHGSPTLTVKVNAIQGNTVTFEDQTGNTFDVNTRTLQDSYILNAPGATQTDAAAAPETGGRQTMEQVVNNRPQRITTAQDLETYKNTRLTTIVNSYNRDMNREQNSDRIRAELANLANELRTSGYPQDQCELVANTAYVVPLNPPAHSLGTIFKNNFTPSKTLSGSKYMHSFLTKDYLLNDFANNEEVKNFINVIEMNSSGVLLKEFKENKPALKNIILGLIRIAYSIDQLTVKYDSSYDIFYKDQKLDDVIFDFEQYLLNNIIAVIKTTGTGHNQSKVVIRLLPEELKRCNIVENNPSARNSDNMAVDEVPEDLVILFGAGENYKEENLIFGKSYLNVIIKDEDLTTKLINFVNGAMLLYPELMDDLPENVSLDRNDFSLFDYLERIEAAENPQPETTEDVETLPEPNTEDDVEATEEVVEEEPKKSLDEVIAEMEKTQTMEMQDVNINNTDPAIVKTEEQK